MQNTNSDTSIKDAILQLEAQQANNGKMLKEQFNRAIDSIQPINIIKTTFKEATVSEDLKNDILNTSVGLVVGYVSQKFLKNMSISPFKKLFVTAVLLGITNVIAKNPEKVKTFGSNVLRMIRNKSNNRNRLLTSAD